MILLYFADTKTCYTGLDKNQHLNLPFGQPARHFYLPKASELATTL